MGDGRTPLGSQVSQLAKHDQAMQAVFVDAFPRREAPLIEGLRRMQSRGELRAEVSVADLADLSMTGTQGGLLPWPASA
ncbi:MAG: hypothetical protein ABR926_11010 [Streptosporangiaceae bacterium]